LISREAGPWDPPRQRALSAPPLPPHLARRSSLLTRPQSYPPPFPPEAGPPSAEAEVAPKGPEWATPPLLSRRPLLPSKKPWQSFKMATCLQRRRILPARTRWPLSLKRNGVRQPSTAPCPPPPTA